MAPASEIFAPDLLRDRVALVTGGGTNLGQEAARELLACGARVVVAGRRPDVLDEAVADLGQGASAVAGDVRDADAAAVIAAAPIERHGPLDVLVNNARGPYFFPAEDTPPKGSAAGR